MRMWWSEEENESVLQRNPNQKLRAVGKANSEV